MKDFLENSRQLARTLADKVGRAINPPLSADAKPLDLQHAIIEAIEARTQPVGGGRRQLPDTYVKVKVMARDAGDERAVQTVLAGVRDRAVARLREMQCDVPAAFRVDVTCVRRRPASWSEDQPMAIEFEAEPPRGGAHGTADPDSDDQPELVLTIVRGRCSADRYALREPAVRVGRSATPVDHRGRARQNHVVFTEDDDPHSRTVGRGHCEIRYDRTTGGYRVFDERSANGTRIVRAGTVIDVPPGDPFGVTLQAGDELQFGTAAAQVEIIHRAP